MKQRKPITLQTLAGLKMRGEKITCLTAYDATFAALEDDAGIEIILVGDSLGMVIQGQQSTLPVTVEDIIYHTQCVSRCAKTALIVADMPFQSYHNPDKALNNAARIMQEGGAHMVKMEGGKALCESIERLAHWGIPVCGHLGLLPQSVNKVGGYFVQGRGVQQAAAMLDEARFLEAAGIDLLVLECVPAALAADITAELAVPVIGIGAGAACDGQVLVVHDMLGMTAMQQTFVKNFMEESGSVQGALQRYIDDVKAGVFPADTHCFT